MWTQLLHRHYEEDPPATIGNPSGAAREAGGFSLKFSIRTFLPRCRKCDAAFTPDIIPAELDGIMYCPQCATELDVHPAPAWLTAFYPGCRQLIGAEREPDFDSACGGRGKTPSIVDTKSLKEERQPIDMQCTRCGGTLSIGVHDTRVTTCHFCKTEFFIPDAVWVRLHPVRTVEEWFLRFDGPSPRQLREQHLAPQRLNEAARTSAKQEKVDAERRRLRKERGPVVAALHQRAQKYNRVWFISIAAYLFIVGLSPLFVSTRNAAWLFGFFIMGIFTVTCA